MSEAATNFNSNNSDAGPPQLAVCLPSIKDVTTTLKHPDLPVDVLLVTVKDCEFLACYNELTDPYRCYYKDVGYVYFNKVESQEGKVKVALLRCNQGSTGPSSSLIVVKNAAPILQPKAVISVGACSGINPDKTKLGDVVVSAKLTTYASKVVTSNQEQSAGMSSHVSRLFSKIISNCADGWRAPLKNPEDRQIKVHNNGEFLSGPEQIRAEWRRKELVDRHPLAAGVEMEGEGVFTAAFDTQLEWLIVKGIADFADGEQVNAESWEACASAMAASLVSHLLSDPGVFRTWPHYQVAVPFEAQLESIRKRKLTENHAGAFFDDQSSTQAKRGMYTVSASQQFESITQQPLAGAPSHIIDEIRQLYQSREGNLAPFTWCDYPNFNMNDIFTRLKIVNREKTRGTLTDDEITNMTAIFRPHPKCQKPRKVLIEGDPGMGKTTYSQKLTYDWANKQNEWDASFPEIEVLLLLRCNDIKSSIWEAIDDQILPEDIDEKAKETFIKYIKENQSKVLLLLDGLDEADPCERDIYLSLLTCKLLPDCHVVITSRHEVGKKVSRYCDNLWEIVGFTEEDSKRFIGKYFQGNDHLAEKFIKYYVEDWYADPPDPKHRALADLAKNPLNLTLLCCIFEDSEEVYSESSRTRLYIEIVLLVLRRYEEKNGLESNNDQDLISVYREKLKLLGRFSLHSLHERKWYFEKEKDMDNFGFLSFQQGGTRSKPCTRCAFSHKSFQEFFAGFYLAFQVIDGQIDFAHVLTDERYLKELKEVFLFMSGIIAFKSEEIGESILICMAKHISGLLRRSDQKVKSYMALACACVFECDCSPLVKLKWKDERELTCFEYTFGTHLDMSSLTEVDLSSAEIQNFGAAVISVVLEKNSSLTHLDLSFNLFDGVVPSLSKALKANFSLTSLNLKGNSVGDDGASSLSKALKAHSSLTDLNLSHNRIGDAGASFLSQALKANSSLTDLNLSINSIGDAGASSLSKALKANFSMTDLNLSCNRIGNAGASSLSKALKENSSLVVLGLTDNFIGDTGASCLSKALKANFSLTDLNLSCNKIGDAGASSLSKALKENSSVTGLNLRDNYICNTGASCLSNALKANFSLADLNLSCNSIGDCGASCLSKALTANSSLDTLDLTDNSVGVAGAAFFNEACKINKKVNVRL